MSRPGVLPVAEPEYDVTAEQNMRNAVEQELQDMSSRIDDNQDKRGKASSLAIRRFQFLLMGAASG